MQEQASLQYQGEIVSTRDDFRLLWFFSKSAVVCPKLLFEDYSGPGLQCTGLLLGLILIDCRLV